MALTKPGAGRGNFTYEDLLHTPDDGKRYEVLEGDLIVSPSPRTKHQWIVHRVDVLFGAAEHAGCGTACTAPMDVVLANSDVVQPDVLFITKDRKGIIAVENIQGAPDLVVEVISEGSRRRDAITKRHIYERYGVRFYWLVDPEEETVRVFELQDGAYGEPTTLRAGQQLTCPLFPGITQDVGKLFAEP